MTTSTRVTEANRTVVQNLYEAGISGDIPGLLSAMADDVVIREPEFLPYGGVYVGKDAFLGMYEKVATLLDVTKIRLEYTVADGDRVIGLLRMPDLNTGQDIVFAEQSTLRDGKVVDMQIFYYDAQSLIGQPKF
jgi:ketosteroid isomerase-like protein